MAETCERTENLIKHAYHEVNEARFRTDLGNVVQFGNLAILAMLEGIARELCDLNQQIKKLNDAQRS